MQYELVEIEARFKDAERRIKALEERNAMLCALLERAGIISIELNVPVGLRKRR